MNDINPQPAVPTITEAKVVDCLRLVVDPEIGCNIVDLGLIYGVSLEGARVTVKMTLTTRGCPMHESIAAGVETALLNLEDIQEAQVDVVWDPPWTPAMMTNRGRAHLGMM